DELGDLGMFNWMKRDAERTGVPGLVGEGEEADTTGDQGRRRQGQRRERGPVQGAAKLLMATARQIAALDACFCDHVAVSEAEGMLGEEIAAFKAWLGQRGDQPSARAKSSKEAPVCGGGADAAPAAAPPAPRPRVGAESTGGAPKAAGGLSRNCLGA
ncbi:unnamed protein product, partial [Prorocentrum cordatum]